MPDETLTEDELRGMAASVRCRFCGDYFDKAKPYICPDCWEAIQSVVCLYPEELLPLKCEALRASQVRVAELEEQNREIDSFAVDDMDTARRLKARVAELERERDGLKYGLLLPYQSEVEALRERVEDLETALARANDLARQLEEAAFSLEGATPAEVRHYVESIRAVTRQDPAET